MRPAVVTAVLLLVGVLNTVTTVHGVDSALDFCKKSNKFESCGDGWSRIDADRCAKSFDTPKTFDDAQEHCRSIDSDLVSVHNFIQMLKTHCVALGDKSELQTYWVGAKKSGEDFIFVDGSEFDYKNAWYYKQPSLLSGNDCAQSNSKTWGYWNDEDCMKENIFVCAKEM